MFSRIRTRVAAVAATSALVLGASTLGAGAANAATSTHTVNGNSVSVTFALEPGQIADVCAAALVTTAKAPTIAEKFTSMDIDAIVAFLRGSDPDVITLKNNIGLPGAGLPHVPTVTASNVPSNVYSLITICGSDQDPKISPAIVVGNPIEAGLGSIQAGSSGENLAAASASLPTLIGLLASGGIG